MKNKLFLVKIPYIALFIILFCLNACTAMHFQPINPPPPQSKLRIAVLPLKGNPGRFGWSMTQKEFLNWLAKTVNDRLRDTGIYEVVSPDDVNDAVGDQALTADDYWWLKNDATAIKQLGKALYADYVMLVKAEAGSSFFYSYDINFVNIETGKRYFLSDGVSNQGSYAATQHLVTETLFPRLYNKLFSEIKGDLLATAFRKGRLIPAEGINKISSTDSSATPSPRSSSKSFPAMPATGKTRLVVHDLITNKKLQVISLILSDALREELFRLGIFSLVNRENMNQAMQEFNLQQSGLIDEKQALEIGKWLAAHEIITGRFEQLGNLYILQIKRMDLKTMTTVGLGSLQCRSGQEESLLVELPGLARKIAGLQK